MGAIFGALAWAFVMLVLVKTVWKVVTLPVRLIVKQEINDSKQASVTGVASIRKYL